MGCSELIRLWPLLFLFALGCNGSEYDLAPVSGTVTLDGEPVPQARVIFEPQRTGDAALKAGPSSNAETDEEGRYTLQTTVNEFEGAVVGLHSVTISTFLGESDRTQEMGQVLRKEQIPPRYQEPGGLTFDVPTGGSKSADFELTTKK